MSVNKAIQKLQNEIDRLKEENRELRSKIDFSGVTETVRVHDKFRGMYDEVEKIVRQHFSGGQIIAENGEINIGGDRYVLIRSAALSYEFLDIFKELYSNRKPAEAVRIGNNFLFDIAHLLGKEDAACIHQSMNITDPFKKMAAGPINFAFTGWANVELLPESNLVDNEDYFIKYYHHNSFEAQSWIKAGRKSDIPVCTMNCGYASGWCEESLGLSLTSVEIECEARGDARCTFIMAPPDRIQEYLEKEGLTKNAEDYDVPVFFQRKYNEDKLRESLLQKETLLKEVHHRVKNNLQVICSLLNLQRNKIEDPLVREEFNVSILRINAMAYIHEMVYGDIDLSSINIKDYFNRLLLSLSGVYDSSGKPIELKINIDIDRQSLPPDISIPMGLIVNEIACNSFKHAYKHKDTGVFYLNLSKKENTYLMVIGDDGTGMQTEHDQSKTLGLSLIEILCDQIDAELKVVNGPEGLEYRIAFKLD